MIIEDIKLDKLLSLINKSTQTIYCTTNIASCLEKLVKFRKIKPQKFDAKTTLIGYYGPYLGVVIDENLYKDF